ncbi:unnamed protein product [Pleuronectes platessa]|uniref:Uncharacterized protein n=1 Tax=Pleuronectes platessa TaxID=8262 RepID=A0A9N7W2T7_PLEPL|nr:unnamed protein product [Pleuronectes platessa]
MAAVAVVEEEAMAYERGGRVVGGGGGGGVAIVLLERFDSNLQPLCPETPLSLGLSLFSSSLSRPVLLPSHVHIHWCPAKYTGWKDITKSRINT